EDNIVEALRPQFAAQLIYDADRIVVRPGDIEWLAFSAIFKRLLAVLRVDVAEDFPRIVVIRVRLEVESASIINRPADQFDSASRIEDDLIGLRPLHHSLLIIKQTD